MVRAKTLRSIIRSDEGVTFIEVSLTLSVFIAVLFGLLYLPLAINSRTSLTISLGEGVRFGVTRGNADNKFAWAVTELGNPDNPWNGDFSSLSSGLQELFEQNSGITASPKSMAASQYYTNIIVNGGTTTLTAPTVPLSYVYALIAVHQYMRTRVGSGFLKYPCDDKPGCLGCKFLNTLDYGQDESGLPIPLPNEVLSANPSADKIAIRCTYNPDFGLLTPVLKLFGGSSSSNIFQIVRSAYVAKASDI